MAKKGKTTIYTEGEYGYRVRVLRRRGRKNLYVAWWDPEARVTVKECLGHDDEERAREQCRQLSDALRRGIEVGAPETEPVDERSSAEQTLATLQVGGAHPAASTDGMSDPRKMVDPYDAWIHLFAEYHDARGKHKEGTQPNEDLRRQKIWLAFFRKQGIRSPEQMTNDHRDEFARQRIAGHLEVDGVNIRTADPDRPGEPVVKPGTALADIVYLHTVLNWGHTEREDEHGEPLVRRKRMRLPRGLKTPLPDRPVATHDDVLDLRRVADEVDPQRLFGCHLRLHDALGWRVSAICAIKASEVCFDRSDEWPYGYVLKNPNVDKRNVGQRVPLNRHSRATLMRLLRRRGLEPGDDAWLFPAPRTPQKPWSRWHHRDLLARATRKAKVRHIGGSHAIRRKWASERKHYPTSDLMAAGGWQDRRSLEAYTQADAETTLRVVSKPTHRIRRAKR